MIFLTGTIINDGQTGGELEAKPNPFIDEEEEILLPDGGTVGTEEGDIIIPDVTGDSDFNADEAYY